jgi:DNA-binding CsgD family transcriptional regulator
VAGRRAARGCCRRATGCSRRSSWHDGDHEAALRHAESVRDRWHTTWHAARGHHVQARIAAAHERWADADRHEHACLDLLVDHGIAVDLALGLDALAEAAAGLERHDEAARLLGAAARAREERGLVRWPADERHFTTLTAGLAEALGERELAEATAEGRDLTTDEAIAWARRARGRRARPSGGWEALTPTELQVVDLVAHGLTNVQIGERMFISRGTAKVHVSNVLRKLGVSTRSEIAAEAARRTTQAHADA